MGIYKETIRKYMVGHQMRQVVSNNGVLDLDQFYLDATAVGATQDKVLFESQLNAMPDLAKMEGDVILVPGIYKSGRLYGINGSTKGLSEFIFSRASAGTYFDKNGIMQTAGNDLPRIDHDPYTKECRGYMIENAAVNLIPWSNEFFGRWLETGNIAMYPNSGVTSYGKPFTRLEGISTPAAVTIGNMGILSQSNSSYCFRITLRGTASSNEARIVFADISGELTVATSRIIYGPGASVNDTNRAIRISGLSTSQDTVIEVNMGYVTGGDLINIYVYPARSSSDSAGKSILIACAQLEIAETCSSYIETTGSAVTRASDFMASDSNILYTPDFGLFFEGEPLSRGTATNLYFTKISPTLRLLYAASGRWLLAWSGGSTVARADRSYFTTNGAKVKTITSMGERGVILAANGSSVDKSPYYPENNLNEPLYVLRNEGAIRIHILKLVTFTRQFTDAEHSQITA